MLYGTITEFCTKDTCSIMTAGSKYEYQWSDTSIKKPIQVSAPEYIEFLIQWVKQQLDDETLFPSKTGLVFPKNFKSIVGQIFKRLFRVYAHVYHHHFTQIVALGQEPHLNTSLKHFVLFSKEFGLIEKQELMPLEDLIKSLIQI
jgi:MOB kinase activator 1